MKILTILKDMLKIRSYIHSSEMNVKKELNISKEMLGRIMSEEVKRKGIINNLREAEFKVYSQWGDDGIIQYLINNIAITNKVFIEFGVEDYQESNTRFLLVNDNWSGLIIDSSEGNIAKIKQNEIYWKYDLVALHAFVDSSNINDLISSEGFSGEIGILSIDIDGNDYWIWKAIEVVNPIVVIVEYNSLFGCKRYVSVPYKRDFNRTVEHYSNLYFGASLPALCHLASEKGYSFVGSDSRGVNAYFVRDDKLGRIKVADHESGYVQSKFKQSRTITGKLNYIRYENQYDQVKGLNVINVKTGKTEIL